MSNPFRQSRRHVFHAVHGQVDLFAQQRVFDFLYKQSFPADFCQRNVEDLVARRLDALQRDGQAGRKFLETGLHPLALMHGQLTTARTKYKC
jgi:hypothetical protein